MYYYKPSFNSWHNLLKKHFKIVCGSMCHTCTSGLYSRCFLPLYIFFANWKWGITDCSVTPLPIEGIPHKKFSITGKKCTSTMKTRDVDCREVVSDCGDQHSFSFWTSRFGVKNVFPFPLGIGQKMGDFFNNRERAPNCSVRFPYNWIYLFIVKKGRR